MFRIRKAMCLIAGSLFLVSVPSLAVMAGDRELVIEVSSEATPVVADAVKEAARSFDDMLLAEVLRYRTDMSSAWLRSRLPSLWDSPLADRTEHTVVVEKPFGRLFQRTITFRVPFDVMSEWLSEQQRESSRQTQSRWLARVVTVATWLATAFGAVWLDRKTNGYQRPAIALLSIALAILVTLSVAVLMWA